MKKVVLLIIVVLLLISSASALVKTRMYGNVSPNALVRLVLTYTANGQSYENQAIRLETVNDGNWEYKISTDEGTIELEVSCLGVTKTFSVPVGPDFRALLSESEETNESEEVVNETTESVENATEEVEETTKTAEENTEEEKAGITGGAITEEKWNIKDKLDNFNTFFLVLALFAMLVIANIVSAVIIGSFKKFRQERTERPIRIIKLSEKLEKAKQRLEAAKQSERQIEQELKQVGGLKV